MLDEESRFSVEENVACSCFSRVGRLEALQLGFKPASKSINATDGQRQHRDKKYCMLEKMLGTPDEK